MLLLVASCFVRVDCGCCLDCFFVVVILTNVL